MSKWRTVVGGAVLTLAASLLPGVAAGASAAPVTNTEAPSLTGTPRVGQTLSVDPGAWQPDGATFTYQWLRDGKPVSGRNARTQVLTEGDLGRRVSVKVAARRTGNEPGFATTNAVSVTAGALVPLSPATISGTPRYRQKLTASPGRWATTGITFTYRWYRDGKPLYDSTARTRTMSHTDVGHRFSVRAIAQKKAYVRNVGPRSATTSSVRHLHDARRTVTYSVVSDGATIPLRGFMDQVAETYADARGWRKGAVAFRRVATGGSFTVVLARADRVPSYSSACSSTYSCRVGRYVIINQDRWVGTTQAWRNAGQSLRNYRHMVVNHETGHWFGKGHPTCGGRGQLAPVMQQQSKGLQGCRPNPWPLDSEAAGLRR